MEPAAFEHKAAGSFSKPFDLFTYVEGLERKAQRRLAENRKDLKLPQDFFSTFPREETKRRTIQKSVD